MANSTVGNDGGSELDRLEILFENLVQLFLEKESKGHQVHLVLTYLKFARLAFPEVRHQFLTLEKQLAACKAA